MCSSKCVFVLNQIHQSCVCVCVDPPKLCVCVAICAWHKPNKFQKNPAVGLVSDLEFMVKGWRSATGKLPGDMFKYPETETHSRLFQAGAVINKLQGPNRKVYNKTEENPMVRPTSCVHQNIHFRQ